MGQPATAKKIIKKSKTTDTNDTTKFLEQQIEEQVRIINEASNVFNDLYDTLIDAEGLLADENIDDIFSINTMKTEVGGILGQINTWRENQQGG